MFLIRHFLLLLTVFCSTTAPFAQNDIQVLGDAVFTTSELSEGAAVTYLIRFQNTGTDTAYQVIVRDTLDPRLDMQTFQMIGASHAYELVLDDSNIARWYFDEIYLPDSTSGGSNSIGFILFTIRLKPFLAPGQTILNHSCITFNQTNTTCTNSAIVWVDANADTGEPEREQNLQIVPNPNYGNFEVRAAAPANNNAGAHPAEWWITDMSGKVVWDGHAKDMAAATVQVWLERPAPGLYLLWVKDRHRLQARQFAVVR
ncbi:MAG: DUF11 domain-containing protein [Lewinellaceae bacterium]|nr:DUF11 domain-containing protein [Lewinellaceae bacterium]